MYVVAVSPADIGGRVSLRQRVGTVEGRPLYSDVVGVLESWQDGALVVRGRDAHPVEVAEVDLLAGKRVPPPPPRRRPRLSTRGPAADGPTASGPTASRTPPG